MLETHGAGSAAETKEYPADALTAALELLTRALAHLDSDDGIPPIMGAYLQSAIDILTARPSSGRMH